MALSPESPAAPWVGGSSWSPRRSASLGIYLGRFLRWNSWDVFHSPLSMADRVWDRIRQPTGQFRMVGFTGLFAALFLFVYLAAYLFGALDDESTGVEQPLGLEGSHDVQTPRGAEGPR